MAAGLTPLDVLNLVLVVGLLAALFGWAGGQGALRGFKARLSAFEDTLDVFDGRIKRREGAVGQAATQKRKSELQQREEEAEKLARHLAQVNGARRRPRVATDQDEDLAAELLDKQLGLNPPKETG